MSAGEKKITINPGPWQLPGVLTVPDGVGPFPCVVFAHGSGPCDRDETVGKQKLFRDLASDLAKLGVASIRYDKRTYIYGREMAADVNLTVSEETVEDVLHAAALAGTLDDIDPGRIYLAGHSMGGYLIPRIAAADTRGLFTGYISLAGSVRSLTELMLEQVDYILSVTEGMSEPDKAAYKKQIAETVGAVGRLKETDRGGSQAVLGACPSYWLDLAGYKPSEEIKSVAKPLLFLQGGHDYQVTETDLSMWKEALKGKPDAAFILYPELTHTFTVTEKLGTPADYATYAKADERVAADIARFIGK